jgi:hypothetical protein
MTLRSTLLSDSASPIIQVVTGQQYAITSMFFCNTTSSDSILQVHLVPDGGTFRNDNKIIHNLLINPGDTFTFDTEKIILDSGDSVQAKADPAGSISATLSYVRVA